MKLPILKERLVKQLVGDLKAVTGVKAIVLGGSWAADVATDVSDIDIGIYYEEDMPFAIDAIKAIAQKYAVTSPTVTGFYEWGPWVNGGAWLVTDQGRVDFLYRNLGQLRQTINKAHAGFWENDYEQQPPYGFASTIYLGETWTSVALYDPEGRLKDLKQTLQRYPPKLKKSIIEQTLWSAEFTIWQTEKFASKEDVYNTMGCFTRVIKCLLLALAAINEIYLLGDKHAITVLEHVKSAPPDLRERIEKILCAEKETMTSGLKQLQQLFKDVAKLAGTTYQSKYQLDF